MKLNPKDKMRLARVTYELHMQGRHDQKKHGNNQSEVDNEVLSRHLADMIDFASSSEKEKMIVIDKNGNVTFSKIDKKNEVVFARSVIKNSYAIIHNHPDSFPFSKEDVYEFALSDSYQTLVIGRNGDVHYLKAHSESFGGLKGLASAEYASELYEASMSEASYKYSEVLYNGGSEDAAMREAMILGMSIFSENANVTYRYAKG